jgi:hypothetical protein
LFLQLRSGILLLEPKSSSDEEEEESEGSGGSNPTLHPGELLPFPPFPALPPHSELFQDGGSAAPLAVLDALGNGDDWHVCSWIALVTD